MPPLRPPTLAALRSLITSVTKHGRTYKCVAPRSRLSRLRVGWRCWFEGADIIRRKAYFNLQNGLLTLVHTPRVRSRYTLKVRKSHRRARFGRLPHRVARRHGKAAASRLRVQGPGAVGGGNGPVAGRASPPRPSPLHPLPRPSSLLQRRQPRHEVRTRPRRARAKAPTVAAVVVT